MSTISAASRAPWCAATATASASPLSARPSKRERIAEQLILFLNKTLVDDSMLRRHERSNQKGFAKFTRADGQIVQCEVMDISVGGVSLKTDVKPPIGEFVLIAQIAGRVARHHDRWHRHRVRRPGEGQRTAHAAGQYRPRLISSFRKIAGCGRQAVAVRAR